MLRANQFVASRPCRSRNLKKGLDIEASPIAEGSPRHRRRQTAADEEFRAGDVTRLFRDKGEDCVGVVAEVRMVVAAMLYGIVATNNAD